LLFNTGLGSCFITKFAKQPIVENLPKVGKTNALSNPVTSNSVSTPQGSKENTKTRRPQHRSNTKNDRVPSASKSSRSQNKEAEVEEHHRNLLLSQNNKLISSACNNIKIDSQDVISKVVCAMCKKCLISVNHDKCLSNSVNGKNSCGKNQKAKISVKEIQKKHQPKVSKPKKVEHHKSFATPKPRKPRFLLRWSPTGRLFDQQGKLANSCGKNQKAKISVKEIQKKHQPKVSKPKKVEHHKSLATPKPRKPRFLLRWSPTGRLFDQQGKLADSSNSKSQYDCSYGDNACTSNTMKPKIKRFPNSTSLLDRLFKFIYGASIRVVPSI
nr:hypothetical protein [Tanacetum cinerariifolium]